MKDPYRAMAEKPMDLEGYLKYRVKLLERDFKISPRKDELDHLRSLKNEHQIDAAIRRIIDERWAI